MPSYQLINWEESPSTPLDGENLSKMDAGIYDAHNGNNNPEFGNYDVSTEPEEPLFVEPISEEDIMSVILTKISKMFQNVRYLLNKPHLVERGTENNWTYEKWSDGTAKCYSHGNLVENYTIGTALGSVYYGASITVRFPENLFVDAPTFIPTCAGSKGIIWVGGDTAIYASQAAFRPISAQSVTANIRYDALAIGRWKA